MEKKRPSHEHQALRRWTDRDRRRASYRCRGPRAYASGGMGRSGPDRLGIEPTSSQDYALPCVLGGVVLSWMDHVSSSPVSACANTSSSGQDLVRVRLCRDPHLRFRCDGRYCAAGPYGMAEEARATRLAIPLPSCSDAARVAAVAQESLAETSGTATDRTCGLCD